MMSDVKGRNFDAASAVKEYLAQVIEDERTQTLDGAIYLDLKTGVAVRQEYRSIVHFPNDSCRDQAHVDVVQFFTS